MAYIAILSNSAYVYRVHPCPAWPYCNGLARTVTVSLQVSGVFGRILYSTGIWRAMGLRGKATSRISLVNFLYCTTISTPYLIPLSKPPFLQRNITRAPGTRTVASKRRGDAGPLTESLSDRGTASAHESVISDPYVR